MARYPPRDQLKNCGQRCSPRFGAFVALLLLLIAENNRALAIKLEAGFSPPFSEAAVQSARTEIVIAAALTVLATASAVTAVIFRSTFAWRLIGGLTLLALILVGPLLWVCYDMAF
ncbi:hypothetical protein K875_00271 [Mycobacterium [tuberculosis] TKK-01-0051]|uniref:Uncharacterized protein n=1 Tax=Mycobacterium [tuberculosis] TKK-01-0051 TaxID=1324261 RepID=A0A051UKS8_9MYCO|nr:hypothetical protein K875_00271 [Mycobacterium [tuberculosis] TKK-01-0051]